jgi:hypothetical protein
MRGGTRSALLALTIGEPAQWRIRGRALTTTGEPLPDARISCVQAGAADGRQWMCLTDSDGRYVLQRPSL